MGKTKDTGHLAHIVQYDSSNNITIPAGLKVNGNDNVMTAAAMTSTLGGYVPASRIITINGTAFDLSADRTWTIAAGLTSFNTRTGAITLTSGDVTGALGFTPSANNHTHAYADITSKPTTISGYGITDAVPSARTITINGTALDLSANRSWTITASETDTLATVTARGATSTGNVYTPNGSSFIANGYNNSGGFAMNNAGQYWGLMWNFANNDWRLGRGSVTAQNGWNLRWDSSDNVFINQHLYLNNNYGSTIVGAYSASRYQGVFAMGDAYKLPLDGTSTGSLYGLAWSHPNAGGVASNLNTHGLLVMENGTFLAAISGSIRARDDMRAPALYDSGNRVAISRGEGRQYVDYSRYVYNNGAYSGSGWIEPSDLGVRYASSSGYAGSAGSAPANGGTSSNTNSISNSVGTSYTWTGLQQFQTNNGGYAVNNSNSAAVQAYSTGNNSAFMSFHKGGHWAVNFGLDSDNWLRIGGWSAGANRWQLNAVSGDMVVNGDVTAFSDARVKENIVTVDNALDKVLALRGVYYNRIDSEDKKRKLGVIAQETLTVVPEVVNTDAFGTYNVSYGNLGGLFIEAFKDQQQTINSLTNQVNHLKAIIDGITR